MPQLQPRPWTSRHRTELGLALATLALLAGIWWHLGRTGPTPQDVSRAVDQYAERVHAMESISTGSLGREMRASVFAPSLRHLKISDRRSFPGYWAVDAVLELEQPLGPTLQVPVRLRVAQQNNGWVILDAEDLTGRVRASNVRVVSQ